MSKIFKKKILFASLAYTVVLLGVDLIGTYKICGDNGYGTCVENLANVLILSFITIPIFLLSVITYKVREEVYRSYIKFAFVWVPLTVILSVLTPRYGGGGILSFDRGAVSFFLSAIYFVISLIIIAHKSWKLRGR